MPRCSVAQTNAAAPLGDVNSSSVRRMTSWDCDLNVHSSRRAVLPANVPPRLDFSKAQAAAYLGVGQATLKRLLQTGAVPPPISLGGRRIWDRVALDAALDRCSGLRSSAAVSTDSHQPSLGKLALLEAIREKLQAK